MPEEYKDLVDELIGGNPEPEEQTAPMGETGIADPKGPEGPDGQDQDSEPEDTEPEDVSSDDEGDEDEHEEAKTNPESVARETQAQKDSRAFAEMRAKNSRYEKALARAAKASNMSVDDFLLQVEERSLQNQAKQMNTDPEILRRMEALEAENQEYRTSKVSMYLQQEFNKVKSDLKIDDKELEAFTADLIKRGHNFQDTNVDYTMLYRGLNHKQLVEKERQAWIARAEKGNSSATTITKKGKGENSKGAINTPEDLDAFLADFE